MDKILPTSSFSHQDSTTTDRRRTFFLLSSFFFFFFFIILSSSPSAAVVRVAKKVVVGNLDGTDTPITQLWNDDRAHDVYLHRELYTRLINKLQ